MEAKPVRTRWARPWRVSAVTLFLTALTLTLALLALAQAEPSGGARLTDEALGACCLPDGSCTQTGEADCRNNLSGAYQGDGVLCSASPCATGACCLPDGSCTQSTAAACARDGGDYQGDGVLCGSVTCAPAATGPCCLPDGSCTQSTAAACARDGGVYQGDGVACADVSCVATATGACCLPDGSCTQTDEADCRNNLGGVYQGDDMACGEVDCVGACCRPDGSCVSSSRASCLSSGGVYRGDGEACGSVVCSPVPTGACCLPDGSCLGRTAAQCELAGGLYQGDGTTCSGSACAGACCLADGSCVEDTASGCIAREGVFQGGGTACATASCAPVVMGACCFSDGSCAQMTERACEAAFGTFQGAGVSCEDASCVTGACCYGDFTEESPGQCEMLAPYECAARRGLYAGDGVSCAENICSAFKVRYEASPSAFITSPMEVGYTVWVYNTGPFTATLNALTSELVGGLGGRGDCALPQTLAPYSVFRCQFTAQLSGALDEPVEDTITARITSNDVNGVEVVHLVEGYMDYALAINKIDRFDPWYTGWILGYDIYVMNTGVLTLTHVVVTDTAPQPWSVVVTPTGGITTATWSLGELLPGERRHLVIEMLHRGYAPNTTITNTVTGMALELSQPVTTTESSLLLEPPVTATPTATPSVTPSVTPPTTATPTVTPPVTIEPPRIYLPMALK